MLRILCPFGKIMNRMFEGTEVVAKLYQCPLESCVMIYMFLAFFD